MGFFDLFSNDSDTSYGYKSFKNPGGLDNDRMLELLAAEGSPYGDPKLGWIRAFGKERQVIVYSGAQKANYIYVDAQPKKIIVSTAPKPGQIGGARDHIDPDDVEEEDVETLKNTIESVEPVDNIIKIVKKILSEVK